MTAATEMRTKSGKKLKIRLVKTTVEKDKEEEEENIKLYARKTC